MAHEAIALQLDRIKVQKSKLIKDFTDNLIFLENLENSLQSILDTGQPLQLDSPQETISMTYSAIIEHLKNIDTESSTFQGVLIDRWSSGDIVLVGSDASKSEGTRGSAAIAAAFSRNSTLNISTPSIFTNSTEILELQAILLALKQAKAYKITNLHITCDNTSALSFLKDSIVLNLQTSQYLQNKIAYNSLFLEFYKELQELKEFFIFLSSSHTKLHSSSITILAQLNALADSISKSTSESFKQSLRRSDGEATPLRAAPPHS